MSLPPARRTDWVTAANGAEHRVLWKPGYDCRGECQHEVKGDHGQHGDELYLWTRFAELGAGASLTLFLAARAGVRIGDYYSEHYPYGVMPAWLHTHFAFPTTEEQVRGKASACDLLDGQCFSGATTAIAAERVWSDVFSDEMLVSSQIELLALAHCTATWARLDAFLRQAYEDADEAHQALPVRCEHCHGRGVIPRTR